MVTFPERFDTERRGWPWRVSVVSSRCARSVPAPRNSRVTAVTAERTAWWRYIGLLLAGHRQGRRVPQQVELAVERALQLAVQVHVVGVLRHGVPGLLDRRVDDREAL